MTVLVERRGPVMIITLNRPERRNAIDYPTALLLERVIDLYEADPTARWPCSRVPAAPSA